MGATQRVQESIEIDDELNALLAGLDLPTEDEITLEKEPETIVVSLEIAEAIALINAADVETPAVAVTVAKVKKSSAPTAKVTLVKEVKQPKVAKEKPAATPYSSKVARLTDKLGEKIGDFTVLEIADAMLDGDALRLKQAETLAIINTSGVKVQNRQVFILEYIAGKSAKLNNVIQSAIAILSKDGFISMGAEGNLYKALVAKPYSVNAAKAMGGNTLLALKSLKVIISDAGNWVANPNSLILAKLKSMGVTA